MNAENLGDFREFFGRKVVDWMYRKIENIFGYIWPILHNDFIESIEIQATYALPSEAPKKSSSTAGMIPADWVAETKKGKNVVKLGGIFCTMT